MIKNIEKKQLKTIYFLCCSLGKFVTDNNDKSPLLSIAFHPTGYYLAAGFVDKLRVYHVLQDELKAYKELNIKNCTIMKFSTGG